jgi:hypothetical protein
VAFQGEYTIANRTFFGEKAIIRLNQILPEWPLVPFRSRLNHLVYHKTLKMKTRMLSKHFRELLRELEIYHVIRLRVRELLHECCEL